MELTLVWTDCSGLAAATETEKRTNPQQSTSAPAELDMPTAYHRNMQVWCAVQGTAEAGELYASCLPKRILFHRHRRIGLYSREMLVEHLLKFGFPDRADLLLDNLAALEQQESGNSANAVAERGLLIGINI